jgi:hypothetical protein
MPTVASFVCRVLVGRIGTAAEPFLTSKLKLKHAACVLMTDWVNRVFSVSLALVLRYSLDMCMPAGGRGATEF